MLVLGIMSGTSVDGVDYALCSITGKKIQLAQTWHRAFPASLRKRIHAAAANSASAHELAQLHHDLGRLYAAQALALKSGAELVGLHGQTVFHNPSRTAAATLQIGEPAYLVHGLGVPVVSNFRAPDIAVGGQGAPLATMFHRTVFARRGQHVCVINLGGIANITSLDWVEGAHPAVLAFDTGPANVLIDLAMREFTRGELECDLNGRWAARGKPNERLLQDWLRHAYFRSSPPKSTGREIFGEAFWHEARRQIRAARLSWFDCVATLAELTARSITLNCRLHLPHAPDLAILCGGGAKNRYLASRIKMALERLNARVRVTDSGTLGWPSSSVEAGAFALLAYLRYRKKPGNLSQTTGARHGVLLGQVTSP